MTPAQKQNINNRKNDDNKRNSHCNKSVFLILSEENNNTNKLLTTNKIVENALTIGCCTRTNHQQKYKSATFALIRQSKRMK